MQVHVACGHRMEDEKEEEALRKNVDALRGELPSSPRPPHFNLRPTTRSFLSALFFLLLLLRTTLDFGNSARARARASAQKTFLPSAQTGGGGFSAAAPDTCHPRPRPLSSCDSRALARPLPFSPRLSRALSRLARALLALLARSLEGEERRPARRLLCSALPSEAPLLGGHSRLRTKFPLLSLPSLPDHHLHVRWPRLLLFLRLLRAEVAAFLASGNGGYPVVMIMREVVRPPPDPPPHAAEIAQKLNSSEACLLAEGGKVNARVPSGALRRQAGQLLDKRLR